MVPCKGCTDRMTGYHSSCERYAEFKRECETANKKKRQYTLTHSPTMCKGKRNEHAVYKSPKR